ncbi:TPA: hypothetical protein ACQZF0_001777 [Escherichia coli]
MNNVFLYRMPVGIAGAVSRPQDLTVEPVVLKSDNAFAAYGLAGKAELARRAAGESPGTDLVKPLIDTGQYRRAITHVVRDKDADS